MFYVLHHVGLYFLGVGFRRLLHVDTYLFWAVGFFVFPLRACLFCVHAGVGYPLMFLLRSGSRLRLLLRVGFREAQR